MNGLGAVTPVFKFSSWYSAKLVWICFSHEWSRTRDWYIWIWESSAFLFFFHLYFLTMISTVVSPFEKGEYNSLLYFTLRIHKRSWGYSPHGTVGRDWRDTCQLPCCTCCNWPQLKTMKMRIQFIQCSSPIQFLQVADFGFISTFYSCFMRENYSGRILLILTWGGYQ